VVLTIEFASSKFYLVFIRGDYFLFGSVFIKKSNQVEFFFDKKTRNRFKSTGFSSVWFGFFEQKPVQTGLARFFPVWVRFFQFQAYKTETEPVSFFKILIGFFIIFSD